MHVHNILQRKGSEVLCASPDDTACDAARALDHHDVGALVVTDEGGRLVGIVAERDLARATAIVRDVGDLLVSQLMSRDVVTCRPTDTIEDVMATMTDLRARHLPVVDGDRLVGLISIGDVVKHRLDELRTEAAALAEYIAAGR